MSVAGVELVNVCVVSGIFSKCRAKQGRQRTLKVFLIREKYYCSNIHDVRAPHTINQWFGAIYNAQGCRELIRFSNISLKTHFQTFIKPLSKLLWVRHWVPQA